MGKQASAVCGIGQLISRLLFGRFGPIAEDRPLAENAPVVARSTAATPSAAITVAEYVGPRVEAGLAVVQKAGFGDILNRQDWVGECLGYPATQSCPTATRCQLLQPI